MVKIDEYLFGYRRLKVCEEDLPKVVNILLKLSISSEVSADGEFVLRERDFKRFAAYGAGRIRYTCSDTLGLFGFLKRLRRRTGVISALSLFFAVYFLLSSFVWDVRIEGNAEIKEATIIADLDNEGFGVGDIWRRIDKNAIETDFLSKNPEISWISINRRGTVAYVRIVESENVGLKEENAPQYSNIVADRDAVIKEIIAEKGVAVVKPGDVVRKGDVLISGVAETESGTLFCRAEGSVIGQCVDTVSAEARKRVQKKVYVKKSVAEVRLKFLNFFINIFKNYGICQNDYDIIENERVYALFGKYRLPIFTVKSYRMEYINETVEYTESEMIAVAGDMLDSMIDERFAKCEILKMRSSGKWSPESYVLFTEVVYYTDIAVECAIEVD